MKHFLNNKVCMLITKAGDVFNKVISCELKYGFCNKSFRKDGPLTS